MPVKNSIRSFAEQVIALKGEEEWPTFLDTMISNCRDFEHSLKQELEMGVSPERGIVINMMLRASRSHELNLLSIIKSKRKN